MKREYLSLACIGVTFIYVLELKIILTVDNKLELYRVNKLLRNDTAHFQKQVINMNMEF